MDLPDVFGTINLKNGSADNSHSDFILESASEYTETTSDEAPDNEVIMAAGQASSEWDPGAIVVEDLSATEEPPSSGIFHSWEVLELCHGMGQRINEYDVISWDSPWRRSSTFALLESMTRMRTISMRCHIPSLAEVDTIVDRSQGITAA